jgi:hypothetical protein
MFPGEKSLKDRKEREKTGKRHGKDREKTGKRQEVPYSGR